MSETSEQWHARMMRETAGMTRPGDILTHLAADAQHHPVPAPPPPPKPEPKPPTPLVQLLDKLADLVMEGPVGRESWIVWGVRDALAGTDDEEREEEAIEASAEAFSQWQKGRDLVNRSIQVSHQLTQADLDDINLVLRRREDGRLAIDVAHCIHCGVLVFASTVNGARADECPNCDGELYPVSKLVALGDGVQPKDLKAG